MPYELNIKNESDYLYVEVTGNRTLDTIIDMAKDILQACDKQGYGKTLIDVRGMTGKLKTIDAYELGTKDLQKFRRTGQLKASIIDVDENRERFLFLESVCINVGYYLRIFSDTDEAIRWLCEG
jgi:hypothetical protein